MILLRIKKVGFCFSSLILILIFGYLLIWPYAYKLTFNIDQPSLSVFAFLSENLEDVNITKEEVNFRQKFSNADFPNIVFHWKIIRLKNNRSKVEIKLNFTEHRFQERSKILFRKSTSVDLLLNHVKEIYKLLDQKSKKYSWDSPKDGTLAQSICICVNIDSKISDKANKMNEYVDELAFYARDIIKSYPRNYIQKIDLKKQTINFDFCFPLKEKMEPKGLPEHLFIESKPKINGKSIDFYGNYSLTHEGWFNLIDLFSKKYSIAETSIIEIFYDSPFSLKDEKKWHSRLFFLNTK